VDFLKYFADLTEAYFGKNDFFPFNREDLKKYDPSRVSTDARRLGPAERRCGPVTEAMNGPSPTVHHGLMELMEPGAHATGLYDIAPSGGSIRGFVGDVSRTRGPRP
jgi:hypothetical protein